MAQITNQILLEFRILFREMKVVILGSNGYVGKHLVSSIGLLNHVVFGVDRLQINFDRKNSGLKLKELLDEVSPRVVINAVGSIDFKASFDPYKLYNSIFLPTYLLYDYFSNKNDHSPVSIFTIGSTAAGQVREKYPIYASLKGAEETIARIAKEKFARGNIEWEHVNLSKLKGGLADFSNLTSDSQILEDTELTELSDKILFRMNQLIIE